MISRAALLTLAASVKRDGAWWGTPGATFEGKLGPWNTLWLDDELFPAGSNYDEPSVAAVRLASGAVGYRIDSQKARGSSGHRLVSEGYQPEPFQLLVRMWRAEQWSAFERRLSDINPKLKQNKLRAYRARQPVLSAYEIRQIYINRIEFPRDGETRQIQGVVLHAIEVFDVKTDKAKPVKQTDINTSTTGLDPKFDFDARNPNG